MVFSALSRCRKKTPVNKDRFHEVTKMVFL
nr:MAG TPA: hypothetical protein [Caudoviricetes sp.]